MYSLLYGFYKYLTQKDEFCVLILGLDNAGKTVSINMLNKTIILTKKIFRHIWNLQKQNSNIITKVLILEK